MHRARAESKPWMQSPPGAWSGDLLHAHVPSYWDSLRIPHRSPEVTVHPRGLGHYPLVLPSMSGGGPQGEGGSFLGSSHVQCVSPQHQRSPRVERKDKYDVPQGTMDEIRRGERWECLIPGGGLPQS